MIVVLRARRAGPTKDATHAIPPTQSQIADTSFYMRAALAHERSSALTQWSTLRLRMSVYVYPTPTKTMGLPVVYTSESAAPTLSEMVSNLVSTRPSINLGVFEIA